MLEDIREKFVVSNKYIKNSYSLFIRYIFEVLAYVLDTFSLLRALA